MKRAKSQVTMLMILGLVLFILVSLALYLSKTAVKKQSQRNVKEIQETSIQSQPIKMFVEKCLDKTAKDAILLLGKQGGRIYKSQGGTLVDYQDTDEGSYFVRHNGVKVAYNILPPKFDAPNGNPAFFSSIPDYPWKTFPYKTAANEESFNGYFGVNEMPPLYSYQGPHSMQSQIEAFIDNNIKSCLDFKLFEEQGYEISINSSKTQAAIGSSDMSIKLSLPLTITNSNTKEAFEMERFAANANIRLNDIYSAIKGLIDNEVTNIKFNLKSTKNSQNLNINLIENAFSKDDLIIATDETSLIYGKPFEYVFARKNRAPALYYIKTTAAEFPRDYIITEEELKQKLGVTEFKAEDPDEDEITSYIYPLHLTKKTFPFKLNLPEIKFRAEASDGEFKDYQDVTVYSVYSSG